MPIFNNATLRVGAALVAAAYLGTTSVRGDVFDVYVDAVNGNDSNTGASPAQAKQTISAVTLTTGLSIGLARGSYWREQIGSTLSVPDGVTVGAYGTGVMPVLDGADVVASGWSKTGGQTNVYQVTWAYPAASTGEYISLWENGIRLRWVSSIALCDATAGTYYVANTNGTGSATVYVNATGSGDPAGNGKTYEIAKRSGGIYGGIGWTVRNIHTRRTLSNNGSLVVLGASLVQNCLAEDGTKHNVFIGAGSVCEDTIGWKTDWPDRSNSTVFVAYAGSGIGYSATFRRCIVSVPISVAATALAAAKDITGFYAHTTGDAAKWDAITYEDCAVTGCVSGYSCANTTTYTVTRPYSAGCATDHAANAVTGSLVDPYCIEATGIANSMAFSHLGGVIAIDGLRHITKTASNKGSVFGGVGTGSVSVTQSVMVRDAGSAGYRYVVNGNHATSTVSMTKSIIYGDANTNSLRAAGTLGAADDNVYYPATVDIAVAGGSYTSFAAYRTAQPALDTRSVATDPLLVNPAAGDFSVGVGSPAIALGAGLLRPSVTYTAIPSDVALAAM